jgi:hypothetical protein
MRQASIDWSEGVSIILSSKGVVETMTAASRFPNDRNRVMPLYRIDHIRSFGHFMCSSWRHDRGLVQALYLNLPGNF